MKRFSICLIIFTAVMASFLFRSGAVTAEGSDQKTSDVVETFRSFSENAEGLYFTSTSEGITALELIPAFGRLFASVGCYIGESPLYSYYAAELIPVCQKEVVDCGVNASASSYDVFVRLFSNMSLAGSYWPGETRQRLTLVPDGLLLSNYSGDGDALISKGSVLLERNADVPGMFPYGSAEAKRMTGCDENSGIPAVLTGSFSFALQDQAEKMSVRFSLTADGTIVMLKDQDNGYPPLLLKGGASAFQGDDGSYLLCWLMSSPASGMMPYSGCIKARTEGDTLVLSHPEENDDDLMLPYYAAEMVYVRDQREDDGR